MKLLHIGLPLFFMLSLTGCGGNRISTTIEGTVDPNYRRHPQIRKMIVKGENLSLLEEGALIKSLKKAARDYDLELINGLDIFPPTKTYSQRMMMSTAQRRSVGFILYVRAKKHENSRYIPITHIRSETSHDSFRNKDVVDTTVESGRYENDRQVNIELKIVDTKNGSVVFVSNGNSFGTDVSFSKLVDAVSEKALSNLAEKHLVIRRIKQGKQLLH